MITIIYRQSIEIKFRESLKEAWNLRKQNTRKQKTPGEDRFSLIQQKR